MRKLSLGFLIWVVACGSSSSEPIDPVATEYCAMCSELSSCERVVNDTIQAVCTEENIAYYSCLTENACDEPSAQQSGRRGTSAWAEHQETS